MKLVYFAWVREQVGVAEEEITPPETVATIADLIEHLGERGDNYALFKNASQLRAAIDQEHVDPATPIAGAREIAIFPPMTGG
ncbi:MAG: molybdopterin converting factor subunit 1 [Pseudomonadota bacterium]